MRPRRFRRGKLGPDLAPRQMPSVASMRPRRFRRGKRMWGGRVHILSTQLQ